MKKFRDHTKQSSASGRASGSNGKPDGSSESYDFLGHAVVEFDNNGKITFANVCGIDISGFSKDDPDNGLSIFRVINPKYQDRENNKPQKTLGKKKTGGVKDNGDASPLPATSTPAAIEINLSGDIILDIAKLRKAEASLREIERHIREVEKLSSFGFWSYNQTTDRLWASDGLYNIYGLDKTRFTLTLATIEKFVYRDDKELWDKALLDTLTGKPVSNLQYRIITPEGNLRTVRAFLSNPEYDSHGNPPALFGIVQDITTHTKELETSKKMEERFSKIFRASPAVISISRVSDGRFVEVDAAFENYTGYDCQSATQLAVKELGLWENEQDREEIVNILRSGRSVLNKECRFHTKTGQTVIGLVSATLINIDGEECIHWIVTDVTKNKNSEEDLRRKTALLVAQLNASPAGIIVVDKGKIILQNQVSRDFLKLPEEVLESNDVQTWLSWFVTALKNPRQFLDEVAYTRAHKNAVSHNSFELKDGRVLDIISNPVLGEDGENYGRIWTFRDVTKFKMSEQALRESESRFRRIFEEGPVGMVISRPDHYTLQANSAFCTMLGYTENELQSFSLQDVTHPEEIDEDLFQYKKLFNKEISLYRREKRYIRKDKEIVWGSATTCAIHGENGQFMYFLSMIEDITQKKMTEEELGKREKELELESSRLFESNIALKVLLNQRENDRKNMEDTILANIADLVFPYIEKLKGSRLDLNQQAFLDMLETNLKEIVSPFLREISTRQARLTPTEIQVADLIKNGKTSKEIALLMNISKRTVDTHRENIRDKLKLPDKKMNLQSYLQSLK